jgi:hypothetical protein
MVLVNPKKRSIFTRKAIAAGTEVEDVPYSDIGTMLNNVP